MVRGSSSSVARQGFRCLYSAVMIGTRYAQRALTARPDLLTLMETRPVWSLEELSTALNLDAPVVQHVLTDLLAQGEIRTRWIVLDQARSSEPHYSLNRVHSPSPPPRALLRIEERVLAFLLGRKETLGSLCTALDHPKTRLIRTLAWLDEHGLITCTFVGHLPLFSLPRPTTSATRTA